MKKNYKKVVQKQYYSCGRWRDRYAESSLGKYSIKYEYFRSVETQNERRQNCAAIADGEYVRGKRRFNMLPTKCDDPRISRTWKRSWKDFTKHKKQYMINL